MHGLTIDHNVVSHVYMKKRPPARPREIPSASVNPLDFWAFFNDKSELCIGVDRASMSNGAQLKQFECDQEDNQTWKIGL